MSDDPTTKVYPARPFEPAERLAPPPAGEAEEADEWPKRTVSRGLRLRAPTAVLLALLVAGGAFWGGVELEKSHGGGSSGLAALASRFRGLAASRGGASDGTGGTTGGAGRGFFGGASSAAATGTVAVVEGNVLYVTTAAGSIVKVDLSSSTKVTRDATASPAALKPGDTVIVQGSKSSSGVVSATSVSATQAGVSATGGL